MYHTQAEGFLIKFLIFKCHRSMAALMTGDCDVSPQMDDASAHVMQIRGMHEALPLQSHSGQRHPPRSRPEQRRASSWQQASPSSAGAATSPALTGNLSDIHSASRRWCFCFFSTRAMKNSKEQCLLLLVQPLSQHMSDDQHNHSHVLLQSAARGANNALTGTRAFRGLGQRCPDFCWRCSSSTDTEVLNGL